MKNPPKQRKVTSEAIDRTKPASVVIDKFGGLTRFCTATGYGISTAHSWIRRGFIPPVLRTMPDRSVHQHIIAVGRTMRIIVKPADFVEAVPVAAGG